MTQPLTATQLSKRCGYNVDWCMVAFRKLVRHGIVHCMNQEARQNRLYGLTAQGVAVQAMLCRDAGRDPPRQHVPDINWSRYGSVCFGHRAAIVKVLVEPLQPSIIKRRARSNDPALRMSANNVRDAIRILKDKGIVRAVHVYKEAHPRYELTPACRAFPDLLRRATWRGAV